MTAQEHAERIARALEAWAEPETWTQAGLETTDLHWMREVRNSDDYGIVWCGAFPAESAHKIAAHIAAANPAALTALLSERAKILESLHCDEHDNPDPLAVIDMIRSWEADAQVKADSLAAHLRRVLEIADTWRPDYATKMDRDTIGQARAALKGQP